MRHAAAEMTKLCPGRIMHHIASAAPGPEAVTEKEKIIDAECKVAPEAIDILNEASKKPKVKK